MPRPEYESDDLTVTETEKRLEKPPLYKVLLHNDDYTTMEFVVFVLKTIFRRHEDEAVRVMLQVHNEGLGVAGVYPYEIAQTKVGKVTELARLNEFPLLCTLEKE